MCDFQKKLPRPSKQYMSSVVNHGAKKSSVDEQLRVLHELIQVSMITSNQLRTPLHFESEAASLTIHPAELFTEFFMLPCVLLYKWYQL